MAIGTQTSTPVGSDPDITEEIFGGDQVAATGLNELLDHLLGGGARILADAGLSRFCPRRLSAIQSGAEAQALEPVLATYGVSTSAFWVSPQAENSRSI